MSVKKTVWRARVRWFQQYVHRTMFTAHEIEDGFRHRVVEEPVRSGREPPKLGAGYAVRQLLGGVKRCD
jgi:hypothetical protein